MSSPNMYNIVVQNNSGRRANYIFACAPPECNQAETQTTAWICADIPQDSAYTVSTTDQVFAWTGTYSDLSRADSRSDGRQENLRQGSLVRNGNATPVQLGNHSVRGTTAHMNVERTLPVFGQSTMNARNGSFEIECSSDVRDADDCLIGMARIGAHGIMTPVAVMQARGNRTVSLAPNMRFYIAEQQCQPGEVIDGERLASRAAVVDFHSSSNGRDNNTAVISQDEHGEFRVQYFHQNESRDVLQAARDGQLRSHIQRCINNRGQRNGQNGNNDNNAQNNDQQIRQLRELNETLNRLISGLNLTGNSSANSEAKDRATAQKRQSLLQMNNILEQFNNGERTEYRGNNGYNSHRQTERRTNEMSNGIANGIAGQSNGVY